MKWKISIDCQIIKEGKRWKGETYRGLMWRKEEVMKKERSKDDCLQENKEVWSLLTPSCQAGVKRSWATSSSLEGQTLLIVFTVGSFFIFQFCCDGFVFFFLDYYLTMWLCQDDIVLFVLRNLLLILRSGRTTNPSTGQDEDKHGPSPSSAETSGSFGPD